MYTKQECIAAVQLAGWKIGMDPPVLTVTDYREAGMSPSVATIFDRFESWDSVKEKAASKPQVIPSSDQFSSRLRCVAAVRRGHDLSEGPITGARYQYEFEFEVTYLEILEEFPTWTQAKSTALADRA